MDIDSEKVSVPEEASIFQLTWINTVKLVSNSCKFSRTLILHAVTQWMCGFNILALYSQHNASTWGNRLKNHEAFFAASSPKCHIPLMLILYWPDESVFHMDTGEKRRTVYWWEVDIVLPQRLRSETLIYQLLQRNASRTLPLWLFK